MSDACWPALGSDALYIRRALFERSELDRSSILRQTPLMWPDWASMVLPTFPERKVGRLPGRNPAFSEPLAIFSRNSQLGIKKILVTEIHAFRNASNFLNLHKRGLFGRIGHFK